MPQMLWIFIAILIVLALIGAVAWLVRRFAGGNIGSSARGRMPRLAVIDAAAVDGRRRLVLVRRDNVEHLLMIGGPSDIVVEPNIVRNIAQRDQATQRGPVGTELPPRAAPLPDAGHWPDSESARSDIFDFPETPVVPERAPRPAFPEDSRRHAVPTSERTRADDFGRVVPTPLTRTEPVLRAEPRHTPRAEPRLEPRIPTRGPAAPRPAEVRSAEVRSAEVRSAEVRSAEVRSAEVRTVEVRSAEVRSAEIRPAETPRSAEAPSSSADQNLAEMAQRLEAALRRPGGEHANPPPRRSVAVDPADRVGAPPVAPETPRTEPASSSPDIAATPPQTAAPKPNFETLEDEMANLLGRPKTPS